MVLILLLLACRPCDTASPALDPGDSEAAHVLGDTGQEETGQDQDQPPVTGITVALAGQEGASSLLVHLDPEGVYLGQVEIQGGCSPSWIASAGEAGWVIVDSYARLSLVSPDGACSTLADLSAGLGLYGVAEDPSGGWYASTLDGLAHVSPDGQVEALATWSADYSRPETFERAVWSLAVALDGTVGLFDLFGGLATWSRSGGLDVVASADLDQPGLTLDAGAALADGTWIALGQDPSGAMGLYRWDGSAWTLAQGWPDEQRLPSYLASDGVGLYLTSAAGQRGRVWVAGLDQEPETIYESSTDPGREMVGIAVDR